MRYWDKPEGKTLQIFAANRYVGNGRRAAGKPAALLSLLALFAACDGPTAPNAEENAVVESLAPESYELACGEDGRLVVALYGGIRAEIDWQQGALSCTGMPRPDDEGARMRLSGSVSDGDESRTLAFILGIPDLEMGRTGTELPTNVTLIEEGTGRFFGTQDNDICWTDVAKHEPIGGDGDRLHRIAGTLYCVSPLAELNGNASVTFTELTFSGRLNWEQPE
jgi:hypothetical protein